MSGHTAYTENLTGPILVRADAGFWSRRLLDTLQRLKTAYSITVNLNPTMRARIAQIPETAWIPITYPDGGQAQVASCTYTTGRGHHGLAPITVRLIVRRTRLTGQQATLWPDWQHHVFVTNRHEPVALVDREHRQHAVVELTIRDLKAGAGLSHIPSGHFSANGAWLACAVLAHNLIRWTGYLGDPTSQNRLTVAATIRTQLIAIPGRLVNRAGHIILRLPTNWPWRQRFTRILTRLRAIPQLC